MEGGRCFLLGDALRCSLIFERWRDSHKTRSQNFPLYGRSARQPCRGRPDCMSDRGLLEPQRLGKEAREDAEREAPGSAEIMLTFATVDAGINSPFAWLRLGAAVVLATIGGVGMWSVRGRAAGGAGRVRRRARRRVAALHADDDRLRRRRRR